MEFKYEALDTKRQTGRAGRKRCQLKTPRLSALQRRGLTITSFSQGRLQGGWEGLEPDHFFWRCLKPRPVLLSRQIATLFEAQVSALRVFRLLAEQAKSHFCATLLRQISDDLQAGSSISKALAKHPKVFSDFYVNMVRSGEESGKLDETFLYLADYIDRSYELTSKARNALIYTRFIMLTFVAVMVLMLTIVIPKIGSIIADSGQELPLITAIVLGFSNFLVDYGIFFSLL
jgi:type II secretory pathway component PulF